MENPGDRVRTNLSASGWRAALLLLCALAFAAAFGATLTSIKYRATSGITIVSTAPDFVDHIVVAPNSPASLSGMRTGELVYRGLADQVTRYRLYTGTAVVGEPLNIPVMQNGRIAHVVVTPRYRPFTWTLALSYLGSGWLLAFVALIIARRPDHPEARLLAGFLIGWVFILATAGVNFQSPWPALDAALSFLAGLCIPLIIVLLARYAMLFAGPPTRARTAITRATYAACVIAGIWYLLASWGSWFGPFDPNGAILGAVLPNAVITAATMGLPVVCVAFAIGAASGTERRRLVWTGVPICVFLIDELAYNILVVFAPASAALPILYNLASVLIFTTPVALTYALLSRRLLDIGFALNRAAVFTATTLLLAGSFAGLQWLANTILVDRSGRSNVPIELAITVIVYYVIRATRVRTDAIVTALFFSHRNRRIRAIEAIANSVDDVNDVQALCSFINLELLARAGIDSQVLLEDSAGNYTPAAGSAPDVERLDRDDRTTVYLRTTRAPVAAPHVASNAVAYPLLVRARLRGVLICRAPDGENEFAPDENRALMVLATKTAAARDDLLAESMRRELVGLREQNLALQTRLAAADAR